MTRCSKMDDRSSKHLLPSTFPVSILSYFYDPFSHRSILKSWESQKQTRTFVKKGVDSSEAGHNLLPLLPRKLTEVYRLVNDGGCLILDLIVSLVRKSLPFHHPFTFSSEEMHRVRRKKEHGKKWFFLTSLCFYFHLSCTWANQLGGRNYGLLNLSWDCHPSAPNDS